MRPLIVIAIETAMRRGEILAMEWNNIDLSKGQFSYPRRKMDNLDLYHFQQEEPLKCFRLWIRRKQTRFFQLELQQWKLPSSKRSRDRKSTLS